MFKKEEEAQTAVQEPPQPQLQPPGCTVDIRYDGSASVMLRIAPDVMTRIRRRAHTQDLETYLWQNILRPALESHVY